MSIADDGDSEEKLRKDEARYESLAIWGGIAVVFGLIVEVALTAVFAKGQSIVEEWGPVGADALVALGVAGEVLFAARARSKTEALKNLSDQKVVEAKMTAAQAHERAAVLEKEAADARERTAAIEKLTAWRRITPQQYSQIVDALREQAPLIDLMVEYERGDSEAFSYAREIAWLFESAGVTKFRADANSYLTPGTFGLRIAGSPPVNLDLITEILSTAGLTGFIDQIDLSQHLPRNLIAPNLYFFVAPRPPPYFDLRKPGVRESSI
jgi:hypothetical protein